MAKNRKIKMGSRVFQGSDMDGTEYEGEPLLPDEVYSLPADLAFSLVERGFAQYVTVVKSEAEDEPTEI